MTQKVKFHSPATRQEIRPDFPWVQRVYRPMDFCTALEEQLGKYSLAFNDIAKIRIAYPHKHPLLFPGHEDKVQYVLPDFIASLKKEMGSIDWVIEDRICDTISLDRSHNQNSFHALTALQNYIFYDTDSQKPYPFKVDNHPDECLFVLLDHTFAQGTTMANLLGCIESNGGIVLAGVALTDKPLAQDHMFAASRLKRDASDIGPVYADSTRNSKLLPYLATEFSRSAQKEKKDWGPAACIALFDKALRRIGNNVFCLTDGECDALMMSLMGHNPHCYESITFPGLLNKLDKFKVRAP